MESASIGIASSITHIIHLEGHRTPPPKSTNTSPAIQSCEDRVERVEDLCRVSSEKLLPDGQPTDQAAHASIMSGSNPKNLPQPSSIAAITLDWDWDEGGAFCDSGPQRNSSPENGHFVQVEFLSEFAVPDDNVPPPRAMDAHLLKNYPGPESGECLHHYLGTTPLQLPGSFPPLDQARGVINIEIQLENLRRKILSGRSVPYIHLRGKPTLLGLDESSFSLEEKAQEFLESNRRVLLLLGDSGSGKSTSLRQLHRKLWTNYKPGDRIPLYIDLPFIDRPDHDLIKKHLVQHNFLEYAVQELLVHRQFTIICDGYDECGLISNLYFTNQLSRQDVKMIISCRSTFLSSDYQGRFLPYGADRYHDNPLDLFEEAVIVPLSKVDIEAFVTQYVLEQETAGPLIDQPNWTVEKFMNTMSTIPNMLALVENPFLLTLALKVLPSLPRDALSDTKAKVTRLKLFDDFLNHWIRVNKVRLDRTIRSPKVFAAFEILCEPDFESSVTKFLLRLTAALSQHQTRRPVVVNYEHSKDSKSWKAEFFGRKIKSMLLRDASPLRRAGIRYMFIHDSLFAYLYSRLVYDPDTDNKDDSDGGDDNEDKSDGSDDDKGDCDGGDDDNDNSDGDDNEDDSDGSDDDNDDSDGGGDSDNSNNGGYDAHGVDAITFHAYGCYLTSGGGGTYDRKHDSSGGNNGSFGGSGGSGYNRCSSGNGESSRKGKDGSGGDKHNARQGKDISHSKKKGRSAKFRPFTSSNPLLNRNLYQDPEAMEFLAERAQSDPRFKSLLLTAIEKSKFSDTYSLAAANAITILFKSGEPFHDINLEGVQIPGDYLESSKLVKTGVEFVVALCLFHMTRSSPPPPAFIPLPRLPSYVPPLPLVPLSAAFDLSQFTHTAISSSSTAGSSSSTVVKSSLSSCSSTVAASISTPASIIAASASAPRRVHRQPRIKTESRERKHPTPVIPFSPYSKPTTSKKLHQCPWDGCGREFHGAYICRLHYSTHTEERRFKCPVKECSKSFVRESDLARHSRRHERMSTYACGGSKAGCKMTYTRSDQRARHEKMCPYFLALGS